MPDDWLHIHIHRLKSPMIVMFFPGFLAISFSSVTDQCNLIFQNHLLHQMISNGILCIIYLDDIFIISQTITARTVRQQQVL
nr:unnamed protein product [Callosobruchus chinensis]